MVRLKRLSNTVAPGCKLGFRGQEPRMLTAELWPQAVGNEEGRKLTIITWFKEKVPSISRPVRLVVLYLYVADVSAGCDNVA